ncbi:MAG: class I SAM-dependent methyltransferase family protein [Thermoplasmatota archaeon]
MDKQRCLAILVEKNLAENLRTYLLKQNILRTDLKIKKDNSHIYLPITHLPKDLQKYTTIKTEFDKHKNIPTSYKQLVSLPENLTYYLPTSYDIIGDIILLKLSEGLIPYKKEIGNALLTTHKNCRTVCLSHPVKGEYRTRNISVIAGEHKTSTIHREYNLFFSVDLAQMYFSPRLAGERNYIAKTVQDGETIIDLFAGVAPFSVIIATYAKPKIIYAVDKNPQAIVYANENIAKNRVLDTVTVICADAKDIKTFITEKADRIIMNLPLSSLDFFETGLHLLKEKGVIHYYDILHEDLFTQRIQNLKDIAEKNKRSITCSSIRKIKSYAPREFYIGIDITATKKG